jgi:hypothetical protein
LRPVVHQVVSQARLHHILCTLSSLYFGSEGSRLTGDGVRGSYFYDNGCGDHHALEWEGDALVALFFNHESERSEWETSLADRDPLQYLPGLPQALRPLAERAARRVERMATSGLWIQGDAMRSSDPWGTRAAWLHGQDQFLGYERGAHDAVFGDAMRQSWAELQSLSRELAELAIRLAAAPSRRTRLSADDDALLFAEWSERIPSRDAVTRVVQDLSRIGIDWDPAWERLDRLEAEREASRQERVASALGPKESALFEAARSEQIERVRALVEEGADVNCRTVEGQYEHVPVGDTPMIQALKEGAGGAARACLELGADPSASNRFGQNALHWAIRKRDGELAGLLLEAGADVNAGTDDGTTALHFAAMNGDIELARFLVAAGADLNARRQIDMTPAVQARLAGHAELAEELEPSHQS